MAKDEEVSDAFTALLAKAKGIDEATRKDFGERNQYKVEEILDEQIVIEGILLPQHEEFGDYALIFATRKDGEKVSVITGSKVIMETAQKIKDDAYPIVATVKKPEGKNYYVLE